MNIAITISFSTEIFPCAVLILCCNINKIVEQTIMSSSVQAQSLKPRGTPMQKGQGCMVQSQFGHYWGRSRRFRKSVETS